MRACIPIAPCPSYPSADCKRDPIFALHSPLYKPTHGDNLGKKKLTKTRRNLQRPRFQDYNRRQECNRLVRLKLGSATTTTDPRTTCKKPRQI